MSSNVNIEVDRIDVDAKNGFIMVRQKITTQIPGMPEQVSNHRYMINPGDDYQEQPDMVKQVCNIAHTKERVDAYLAKKKAEKEQQEQEELQNNNGSQII